MESKENVILELGFKFALQIIEYNGFIDTKASHKNHSFHKIK